VLSGHEHVYEAHGSAARMLTCAWKSGANCVFKYEALFPKWRKGLHGHCGFAHCEIDGDELFFKSFRGKGRGRIDRVYAQS